MKHTPGPWTVDLEISEDGPAIAGPDHVCFALIQGKTFEHEANANLIAAAPEMLSLLEHLCSEITSVEREAILFQARAVIAKARGES